MNGKAKAKAKATAKAKQGKAQRGGWGRTPLLLALVI